MQAIDSIRKAMSFDGIITAFEYVFPDIKWGRWEILYDRAAWATQQLLAIETSDNQIDRIVAAAGLVIFDRQDAIALMDFDGTIDDLRQAGKDVLGNVTAAEAVFNHYTQSGVIVDSEIVGEAISSFEAADKRINEALDTAAKTLKASRLQAEQRHEEIRRAERYDFYRDRVQAVGEENRVKLRDTYASYQRGEIDRDEYERLMKAANDEYRIKTEDDLKEMMRIAELFDAVSEEHSQRDDAIRKAIDSLMKDLNAQKKVAVERFGAAVTEKILSVSPITQEAADTWAARQDINRAAVSRLKKIGYPINDVRRDMAEFYRLVGGRLGKVELLSRGDRRAKAYTHAGRVFMDGSFNKRTLFHEMGHLLEASDHIMAAGRHFLQIKAGPNPKKRKLKDIVGERSGYRDDEVAYEDGFFNPYVGKIYTDGITEVWSMGMQMFSDPEKMFELFQKDPLMFDLISGLMNNQPAQIEIARANKADIAEQARQLKEAANQEFYRELTKIAGKRVEKMIEGTYYSIDGYKSRQAMKRPNRLRVVFNGRSLHLTPFAKRAEALNFLYLFLWKRAVDGAGAAGNVADEIAYHVSRGTIPIGFPDRVKPDVQIEQGDKLSGEDLRFVEQRDRFFKELRDRGFVSNDEGVSWWHTTGIALWTEIKYPSVNRSSSVKINDHRAADKKIRSYDRALSSYGYSSAAAFFDEVLEHIDAARKETDERSIS